MNVNVFKIYSFSAVEVLEKRITFFHGKGALEVYPNKIKTTYVYRKSVIFVKLHAN